MITVQLTPTEFTELYDVIDNTIELLDGDDERIDLLETILNKLQDS